MGEALSTDLATEALRFGFNQNIPIDLPGAAVSSFPTKDALSNDDPLQATSAFGQGFGQNTVIATPLQMALVAAGIANDGVIMTPHVMEQIRDSQGGLVETYAPKPWLTATNPLTAAAVTSLMQKVVTQQGATAYGLFPSSWDVAAKTGTAETGGGILGNSLTNDRTQSRPKVWVSSSRSLWRPSPTRSFQPRVCIRHGYVRSPIGIQSAP